MHAALPPGMERSLSRPLRLTWAGLWAERVARAFWPLWSLVLALLSALSFGVQDILSASAARWMLALAGLAVVALAVVGWRRFHRPTREDALARLDAALPGQPIAALRDTQAIGADDPLSAAVWQTHLSRMAGRARQAAPVAPDLKLSSRDPYALRYVALTAFVMALMFGSVWRLASVSGLAPGPAEALVAGPTWEGWAQPPSYTGKPALYLADVTSERVELPVGTRVQIRTYGEVGSLQVSETVSAPISAAAAAGGTAPQPAVAETAAEPMQGVYDFAVAQSGAIEIAGPGGRVWQVVARADAPPTIAPAGEIGREADGRFRQGFTAGDDYGVVAGQVSIALDLPSIDRRFGLVAEPEPREAVVLDLPMPVTGSRSAVEQVLVDDLSEHPFANLPVTMTFSATDAAGQVGTSAPLQVVLPGRRFFDPLAAAIIEMRRDLLWTRTNAPRSAQILKAVLHRDGDLVRDDATGLRLRVALRELDSAAETLSAEERDRLAKELWEIALAVEEGDLADALERLRRAQDRLDEAIRNGASPEEIDELMREMQQALNEYMQELAERAERSPEGQQQEQMEGQQFSADQLQQMLDELQRLMEEGRTAEAAELMEQLRQLMENMQVTQGQGGQGQGGPGQQSMREMQETLRDQQELSDDAFRDMQQGNQGQQPGEDGQQGEGQQGEGQQGEGQGPGGSLTDRQRDLRQRLGDLQSGPLPGDGTEEGEAGRDALDRADRAMRDAEEALRDGDLPGALDRQAEAMEALRDGMRNFGEALAQQERETQPGQAQEGDPFGNADPNGQRDPLGREPGNSARIGSDRNMVQEDTRRRAQELLDEIRRRSGEQARPEGERDYLRRLLDQF